jgi:hypothetical protein
MKDDANIPLVQQLIGILAANRDAQEVVPRLC